MQSTKLVFNDSAATAARGTRRDRGRRCSAAGTILTLATIIVSRKCSVSAELTSPGNESPTEEADCWVPCRDTPYSNVAVPFTDCRSFYSCWEGRVSQRMDCNFGAKFDVNIGLCNHESLVKCNNPTCPPTPFPTKPPTHLPTTTPTVSPTVSPTESPTDIPTVSPTESPTISPTESPTVLPKYATAHIKSKKNLIEDLVLKSYNADGTVYPSVRFTFDGFIRGLGAMGDEDFGDGIKFMLMDQDSDKFTYGLVNVAAFLSQAMVEGIYHDTCDELNWQQVAGRYAISNACGQEGRSYQDETCGRYSCIVDVNMRITAIASANEARAPPPLECRPGSGPNYYSGYWDTNTGMKVRNTPYANTGGRIDVEGCCYWGRGVLLTRGVCNIGKLNYYLGSRAAKEGRKSIYPNIDFCVNPEAPCASEFTEELRWTTALFEWSERVQRYSDWDYAEKLIKFVDEGMGDDSFIEAVGRISAHDCHAAGCSRLPVRRVDERKRNFYVIVNDVFGIDGIRPTRQQATARPTRRPAPVPVAPVTPRPSRRRPLDLVPRPFNPFTTPKPTPQPLDSYAPPKPGSRPPHINGPLDLTPQVPSRQPPIFPSSGEPAPSFASPEPIGTATVQPFHRDSDTQREETEQSYSPETLIPIKDNGAEARLLLFKPASNIIFGLTALYFLFTNA